MAHPDLNTLLNELLPFADKTLVEHGEFYPFGASMSAAGEIKSVGASDGTDHAPSQSLIEVLICAFRSQAQKNEIRAAAICYDVRVVPPTGSDKTDAVCCSIEHQNGEAVNTYLPYHRSDNGDIEYGEMFAERRTPQFFAP
jgi:hypothetical protein